MPTNGGKDDTKKKSPPKGGGYSAEHNREKYHKQRLDAEQSGDQDTVDKIYGKLRKKNPKTKTPDVSSGLGRALQRETKPLSKLSAKEKNSYNNSPLARFDRFSRDKVDPILKGGEDLVVGGKAAEGVGMLGNKLSQAGKAAAKGLFGRFGKKAAGAAEQGAQKVTSMAEGRGKSVAAGFPKGGSAPKVRPGSARPAPKAAASAPKAEPKVTPQRAAPAAKPAAEAAPKAEAAAKKSPFVKKVSTPEQKAANLKKAQDRWAAGKEKYPGLKGKDLENQLKKDEGKGAKGAKKASAPKEKKATTESPAKSGTKLTKVRHSDAARRAKGKAALAGEKIEGSISKAKFSPGAKAHKTGPVKKQSAPSTNNGAKSRIMAANAKKNASARSAPGAAKKEPTAEEFQSIWESVKKANPNAKSTDIYRIARKKAGYTT